MKAKLKNLSTGVIGLFVIVGIYILGAFLLKGGTWVFEIFYPAIRTINSIVFSLTLLLLLLSLIPKLRLFTGVGIWVGSWMLGGLFWLFCLYLTYVLWGLGAAIVGVLIMGVGVFITASLALLFHGAFVPFLMLLLTLGVIYALRVLGIWFGVSRAEEKIEVGNSRIVPVIAFAMIGIFIVMSAGFPGALTGNTNQSHNQSRENPFESLNSYELDKFSTVIAKVQERPLSDSDVENLRTAFKSYVDRTGNYLTQNDIEWSVREMNKSNEYLYELNQSLLFSWDNRQPHTTNRFDELYREMQRDGSRKSGLLQKDMNCIQAAARNQTYTEDSSGNKYEFSRELILESLDKIDVSRKNVDKVIAVFKEFVR